MHGITQGIVGAAGVETVISAHMDITLASQHWLPLLSDRDSEACTHTRLQMRDAQCARSGSIFISLPSVAECSLMSSVVTGPNILAPTRDPIAEDTPLLPSIARLRLHDWHPRETGPLCLWFE